MAVQAAQLGGRRGYAALLSSARHDIKYDIELRLNLVGVKLTTMVILGVFLEGNFKGGLCDS